MRMSIKFKKVLCIITAGCLLSVSSFANVQKELMTLQDISAENENVSFNLSNKILKNLDRPEVIEQARKNNIDIEEEKKRIAALTDREIKDAISGGNKAGGEVIVISVTTLLLIIIAVLLID